MTIDEAKELINSDDYIEEENLVFYNISIYDESKEIDYPSFAYNEDETINNLSFSIASKYADEIYQLKVYLTSIFGNCNYRAFDGLELYLFGNTVLLTHYIMEDEDDYNITVPYEEYNQAKEMSTF